MHWPAVPDKCVRVYHSALWLGQQRRRRRWRRSSNGQSSYRQQRCEAVKLRLGFTVETLSRCGCLLWGAGLFCLDWLVVGGVVCGEAVVVAACLVPVLPPCTALLWHTLGNSCCVPLELECTVNKWGCCCALALLAQVPCLRRLLWPLPALCSSLVCCLLCS